MNNSIFAQLTHKNLVLYIIKCLCGCLVAFAINYFYPAYDINWFLISVVLVLSPDSAEVVSLAQLRVKANVVGAICSLFVLYLGINGAIGVSIAFIMTILACFLAGAASGGRAALAAVVIIMLHHQGGNMWETGLQRVIAVIGGCALGLALTYAFHRDMLYARRPADMSKPSE